MYNKFFEYLLSNDPEAVISTGGLRFRKLIHPALRKVFPMFASSKWWIIRKEKVPNEVPLIYASSHGFKDDIPLALNIIGDHVYMLFASIPVFFVSVKQTVTLWKHISHGRLTP